jgi:hypothetical protein
MSRIIPAVLGVVLLVHPACTGTKERSTKEQADIDFENYPLLAEAIGRADKVVLYEGLPHQMERGLLERELREKKTIERHGFPFYTEPLALTAEDGKTLIAMFTDPGSFRKWRAAKGCGGFHPDYLVEYHVGDEVYQMLVCFGCHDVNVYGPKGTLYCEINSEPYEAFVKVLKPYRKNRP